MYTFFSLFIHLFISCSDFYFNIFSSHVQIHGQVRLSEVSLGANFKQLNK